MELLLLSSSAVHGTGYLDHAMGAVREWLGTRRRLAFVPFALAERDAYVARVRERFTREGIEVEGVPLGGRSVLERAEAVFVGGGNTFRLLKTLQDQELLKVLREGARGGTPYMGSSAGSNLAAPTIRTTNDMPIVEPRGLDALGLVPFQINPHYEDKDPASRHMGETREERLLQYLEENARPVLGLREGSWLRASGSGLVLGGKAGARLFARDRPPEELAPGARLDRLLLGSG
jgi:dipeptidase E